MARYTALHTGRYVLSVVGVRPAMDTDGEFSEVRNMDQIWPRRARVFMGSTTPPPWGRDATARDRLKWLLANGADLWMPLPEQQDQRHEEVHGDAIRALKANRQNAIALGAALS